MPGLADFDLDCTCTSRLRQQRCGSVAAWLDFCVWSCPPDDLLRQGVKCLERLHSAVAFCGQLLPFSCHPKAWKMPSITYAHMERPRRFVVTAEHTDTTCVCGVSTICFRRSTCQIQGLWRSFPMIGLGELLGSTLRTLSADPIISIPTLSPPGRHNDDTHQLQASNTRKTPLKPLQRQCHVP